jgi:predicted RNA-binding protein with TRAM domain
MTNRTDELASLFTARVTDKDGRYRVSIPKRLVERGQITDGDLLRVALIDGDDARRSAFIHAADAPSDASSTDTHSTDTHSTDTHSTDTHSTDTHSETAAGRRTPSGAGDAPTSTTETTASPSGETTRTERSPTEAGTTATTTRAAPDGPPVSEGERRTVTIETLGDEGDGIAKVERGYVVIVSDAEPGDTVTVEITNVRENVSFGSIVSE